MAGRIQSHSAQFPITGSLTQIELVEVTQTTQNITSSRTELIMVKNKKSLRVLLREFADETSAHGIGKVKSAESIIWRLFWILVTLACFGMVFYQGILLIETFLGKPVKSDIDVEYSRTVLFPAVTICNLNIIKKSFIHKFPDAKRILSTFENFVEGKPDGPEGPDGNNNGSSSSSFGPPDKRKQSMKNALNVDSSNAQESVSLSNISVDPEAYARDEMLSMLASHDDEELMKGGHDFHEMVYRCNWKDFSCKDGDFMNYWKHTWNWRYGNCYTFNSGATNQGKTTPVLTSSKPGPKYGLTLDLFVNQKEYIPSLSQEAGVRVLLSDQRKIPFPFNNGFTVSPGFATSIGLRKLAIVRVDPFENGSCYSDEAVENFSIYSGLKGSKYSVQGCMYSCLARAQVKYCNCTEGKFRFGEKICTNDSEVECVQDLIKKYDNDDLGCASKCPQPCTHHSFRTSMSSASWSDTYEKQLQGVMMRRSDQNIANMGKDRDMLRENFLRIKIYFDELNMETITYTEYYQIENLMSDIGGQLGLWVGVSVITVAEVIKLLLDIFKVLCRKAGLQQNKEIRDVNMSM